ncbi:MAG: WYL domain-containing protein [Acidobacteriota bacterium]
MSVERHGEIVRQWRILLALEGRARGLSLAEVRDAAGDGVSERTIRRDLDALTQAGFPIESSRAGGKTRFTLNRDAYRSVTAAGLTLQELCALHLSRAVLATMTGSPFHQHLERAFDKLTDTLPASLWRFVDQLPQALAAKGAGAAGTSPAGVARAAVETLVEAVLARRRVRMRYRSLASRREKEYLVEPYRLAYAQGALYLFAFVPEYGEMRTFATQRVASAVALEERFTPAQEIGGEAFPHALGAFMGQPEPVAVVFAPAIAPYIRERTWHASQAVDDLPDGAVRLRLRVATDWSLQAWLMSFGPLARVEAPDHLVTRVARDLGDALAQYPHPSGRRRPGDRSE